MSYYYSDHDNYTETYLHDYGLSQQTALGGGIGYCLFTAISLLLYIRLLTIIYFDKHLSQLPSYRIILQNGYSDCIMIVLWMFGGICSIALSTFNATFAKILGAVYLFGVHSSSSFTLLIAINRFVQIVFAHEIDTIFGKKLTMLYIIICWLTALPTPIIALTTVITSRYNPYWLGYGYVTDSNSLRFIFINIDTYAVLVKVGIATILYIIAIVYMIFQRKKMTKSEVRLTIQTMIDAIFRSVGLIYRNYFPSATETFLGAEIDNILQFLANVVDVYVYMTFNRTLRVQFVPKMFSKKKNNNNNKITTHNHQTTAAGGTQQLFHLQPHPTNGGSVITGGNLRF